MNNLPPITHFIGKTPMQQWISKLDKFVHVPIRFSMQDFYLRCYKNQAIDRLDYDWYFKFINMSREYDGVMFTKKRNPYPANEGLLSQLNEMYRDVVSTPRRSRRITFKTEEGASFAFNHLVKLAETKGLAAGYIPLVMARSGGNPKSGLGMRILTEHLKRGNPIIFSPEGSFAKGFEDKAKDYLSHTQKAYDDLLSRVGIPYELPPKPEQKDIITYRDVYDMTVKNPVINELLKPKP